VRPSFIAVSSPPKLPAGSNAGLDIRRTMFSRKDNAAERGIASPLFCPRYATYAQYYAVILKPGPPYTRPRPEPYLGDMDTLVTIPAVPRRHDRD
jgi:hypothetical protein